jgi:putative membrane protein
MEEGSNVYKRLFIIVSILIPAVVAVLLYLPKGSPGTASSWIYTLPSYNAIINTLTAVLLILGVYFVKQGQVKLHKASMIGAFILGSVFLVFYVIYHSNAESTKFGGEGIIKIVYFFFLITHILLAFIVVPLVLSAIYFAVTEKLEQHRKIVKYTFPVWLYVSVTGVIVYLMISPYYTH